MLGVVLFRRTPKGLELTGEANAGLDALRQGFLQFEESVRAMQAGQSSQSLTIAAPRDLTAKWLAPRLARYSQQAPDVRFTLVSADGGIDFTEANLRSEEHTSELQSLMRISYAVFCLQKKKHSILS